MQSLSRFAHSLALLAALAGVVLVSGCGESRPKPKPVAPPPPAPAAAPAPTLKSVDVSGFLQTMKADKRVQFPQEKAPADERVTRSIIELASALAKGDAKAFGAMLTGEGKDVLEQLQSSGQWEEATGKIEAVRVVEVAAPGLQPASFTVSFAVQEPGNAYILRFSGTLTGDKYLFTGQAGGRLTHPRANQFDDGRLD